MLYQKLQNHLYNKIIEFTKPYNLFTGSLAGFSTLATGFLSFAGAMAFGASFPIALTVFFLTAVVSLQVNLEMIDNAIQSLSNFFFPSPIPRSELELDPKDQQTPDLDPDLDLHSTYNTIKTLSFIAMSVLAALSVGAASLFSAVALLPFSWAIVATIISTVAYFFISYEILQKADEFFLDLDAYIYDFLDILNEWNPILKWLMITFTVALLAAGIYYSIATISTWWIETGLGLSLISGQLGLQLQSLIAMIQYLTVPFSVITHALFIIVNPFKVLLELSGINLEFKLWSYIENKPWLKFNPFYYANTLLVSATKILLFLAHSMCHALMAGRTSPTAIIATVLDAFSDALYIIGIKKNPSESRVARRKAARQRSHEQSEAHDHDHNHGHEPFDFIVVLVQTIVSFPLNIFSVPLTIFILLCSGTQRSFADIVQEAYAENFYFIGEYINKTLEHEHSHSHEHAAHAVASPLTGHPNSGFLGSSPRLPSSEEARPQASAQGCASSITPLRDLLKDGPRAQEVCNRVPSRGNAVSPTPFS